MGNRAMLFDKEQALQSRLSDARLNYSTTKERVLSLMRETKERERDLDRCPPLVRTRPERHCDA